MITIKDTDKNTTTKIIGLDPGSTRTNPSGWALFEVDNIENIKKNISNEDYTKEELEDNIEKFIVDNTNILDYGTVKLNGEKECLRLSLVFNGIYDVVENKDIDFYVYERQYGPSGKSLKVISQVIGALRLAMHDCNIEYFDAYTPNHIKKIMTGNGRANKEDIKNKITSIYNIDHDIEKDESDAIAIAYTAIYHAIKEN